MLTHARTLFSGYKGICLNFNENDGCGICTNTPFGFNSNPPEPNINFDLKYEGNLSHV